LSPCSDGVRSNSNVAFNKVTSFAFLLAPFVFLLVGLATWVHLFCSSTFSLKRQYTRPPRCTRPLIFRSMNLQGHLTPVVGFLFVEVSGQRLLFFSLPPRVRPGPPANDKDEKDPPVFPYSFGSFPRCEAKFLPSAHDHRSGSFVFAFAEPRPIRPASAFAPSSAGAPSFSEVSFFVEAQLVLKPPLSRLCRTFSD